MSATSSPADTILTRYADRAAAIAAERCREQDATDTGWIDAEKRMRAAVKTVSSLADVCIDTKRRAMFYRDFIIEESIDGWEWTHKDFERVTYPVTGLCQTVFECIDAVDAWHNGEIA